MEIVSTKEDIRRTLIALMDETGTKGTELAAAVGVTKQAVSAWRTGKSSIDVELIPAICDYLGLSVNEFFGRADSHHDLTPDEHELVDHYRECDDPDKAVVLTVARMLGGSE